MNSILNLLRIHRREQVDGAVAQDELFLFVHMPKTGGQSLRRFFLKHLVEPQRFIHLVTPEIQKDDFACLLSDFAQRPLEERMQARVIIGHKINKDTHKLVPGKIPRHILILREPAERLVSYYNFHMKVRHLKEQPLITFEEWYERSKQNNMMTRWLLKVFMLEQEPGTVTSREWQRIQKVLHTFWFVACTEHLDRDAPLLFQRMGFHGIFERANVSGLHHEKTLTLDAPLRERLRSENPIDVELYEYWKAKLGKTLDRIRLEIHDRVKTGMVPPGKEAGAPLRA